jgi:small redox-active disulfide protein 2
MLSIKVLGPGCPNCARLEKIVKKVVASLAIEAEVIKVSNYNQILEYDILSTPGLVINEEIVFSGKVPSETQVIDFITGAIG